MIRKLSIRSFKSLSEVDLELGRVNVFIGANGSGKSNLIEAVGVLGAAADGRVDDEALLRRGVRPGLPTLYKSSFAGEGVPAMIRLEAASEGARYWVELNNSLEHPDPAWSYETETLIQDEKELVRRNKDDGRQLDAKRGLAALKAVEFPDSAAAALLERLSDFAIYAPNTNTLRALVPDPQMRDPVGLAGGRLAEGMQSLIAEFREQSKFGKELVSDLQRLVDWAKDFGYSSSGSHIPLAPSVPSTKYVLHVIDRFMAEGRNVLTGYDASEGALYVLFSAILAIHPRAPRVLGIDNVDQALNPRLARALMEQLCSWVLPQPDKQLLLTTHNPLMLDGLDLENDEIRLFTVGRSRKGKTVVRRVQLSLADLQRDGELWTVSRLWVMGHLGGVPDV
jgi:energy-coupling factor transporter ATP-binding protein EcfA2